MVRELACIAVANIPQFNNPSEIIKLIIERVTDSEPAVQIAAIHATINLAHQYSEELINIGIVSLVQPIIASHITVTDQLYSGKQEELVYQSLVSTSLYLLSTLCTENEKLSNELKLSILTDQCIAGIMSNNKIVALPCIDLLVVFTESDLVFSQKILSSQSQNFFALLPSLDSETKIALVSLVVTALEETQNFESIFKYALPVVLEVLTLDIHSEFLLNVKDKLSEENFKAQEHFWTTEAKAQQGALEILTNLLASEDEAQPAVLQHLTIEHIKFISKAANGVPKDVVQSLFNYPELMTIMISLQHASFSCVQNLILNTSTLQAFVSEVWTMLIDHFDRSLEFSEEETEIQEDFIDLLTVISKNLCALCKKYPEIVSFQTEKQKIIPGLLQGIHRKVDDLSINFLGVLSCVAKDELTAEVVQKIVECLVLSCGDENLEVNTEALNVFFDVFNDEKYDSVLRAIEVMPMMAAGVEDFSKKICSCEDLEVREHAQEALENLVEFIKYKALNIPN
jgi:hypothetical protein